MIKNIASTFAHKFLIVFANLLIVILTSQVLGSEGRGETSLFVTDFMLILLFSGIVAGSSMSYFTPKKDIFTISVFAYAWSIAISILGVFILHFLHPTQYTFWLFGAVLVQSFATVHQMVLLGRNSLFAYNFNTAIQPILNLAYVYFYFQFLNKKSVDVFVQGYFYSSLVAYLVSIFQSLRFYTKTSLVNFYEIAHEMVRFGSGTYFSTIIQTITYRASYYVLFWFGLSQALGELSNGVALVEGTWVISNSLSLVLYAHVLNTDYHEGQKKITLQMSKLCFVLTTASLILLLFIPSDVYVYIFGKDFGDLRDYILILSPSVMLLGVSTVISHYYAAKGNYGINNIKSAIGLVTVLLGLLILIPLFGKKGAAFATSISYTLSSFYIFYHYFKATKTPIYELFKWMDLKELWTKKERN